MKWLILLFSLIAIDTYLSGLILGYLGPILLSYLYAILLATGAIILFSRRSTLAIYFQQAAGSHEDVKSAQKKGHEEKIFQLIQISLAALAIFLLLIPGGITSLLGILLTTEKTSHFIVLNVVKKNMNRQ